MAAISQLASRLEMPTIITIVKITTPSFCKVRFCHINQSWQNIAVTFAIITFLVGVCDHTGKFIDCLIGRPGRAHDASIFRSSIIYERLMDPQNPLLPPDRHLLGDSAYPLLRNLMTLFRDNGNLTQAQATYNTRHASIRSIIERAYALLKGKWRRLKYLDVKSVEMANSIVAAACTFHNFLLLHNEADIRHNHNIGDGVENAAVNDDDDIENEIQNDDIDGRTKRQEIMNSL